MRNIIILLILLFSSSFCWSQYSIKGRIIDSASAQPLVGASVYAQNTTQGTITNSEGYFVLPLKSGGYDLAVSFTGYQTKQIRVSASDSDLGDVQMLQEDKSLQEVIIRSSNEIADGWEQYGSFFLSHFIGTTPFAQQTKLLNPEVLRFFIIKRTNKLRVMAREPLQISNEALGYKIQFQLDSFMYYYDTDVSSFRGYPFYTEMEGHRGDRARWAENRKKAYYGSKLHFMRSYYDTTLAKEGFNIDLQEGNDSSKFVRIGKPYDSKYFGIVDSTGDVEVWYPNVISVTYTRQKPEQEYLEHFKLPLDVPHQISYIHLTYSIFIQENGFYYDARHWVNQGYWSWKNLADFLPFDYNP